MWIFTKRWPQQRSILQNKWMRWPVLCIPVSFIPWPSCHQWVHEQSGHGGRDGGYPQAQQRGLVLRLTWLQPPLSAQTAAAVTSTEFRTWCHSPSEPPGGMLVTLDHFHHGSSGILFLLNRHLFWIWICLLCLCFCQNTCEFTEYLIHHHGDPHNIASDQGTWPIMCGNGPTSAQFTGLAIFPAILKQWIDRMAIWKLKLQLQLGGNIFRAKTLDSRRLYML